MKWNEHGRVCSVCSEFKSWDEYLNRSDRPGKKYSQCRECYIKITRERSYIWYQINKRKGRRSPLEMTEELRKEWVREKSAKRYTRAKNARVSWDKELTDFVFIEARKLLKLRKKHTNIDWHVDHIIPLRGKEVCGLHVWNNFQVIPKVENLRKGNKLCRL